GQGRQGGREGRQGGTGSRGEGEGGQAARRDGGARTGRDRAGALRRGQHRVGGPAGGARAGSGGTGTMPGREKVMRMSVEQPLWRALAGYRVLTMVYAVGLFTTAYEEFTRPWLAVGYFAVLAGWTLATLPKVANEAACTKRFLTADLTIALTGILLTPLADTPERVHAGGPTLPSIWTAGAVLAFAIKGGWRWAAGASVLVAVANLVERGTPARDTVHNVILVSIASIAIGYGVEVARASERTLARPLGSEAATRERERLARDIHDSVLQVLAMVQRRGAVIGGEAAELGRMAGEQEVALRTLVSGGLLPTARAPRETAPGPATAGEDDGDAPV